ncbi:hypothetical protein NPIL_448131, partial [Nephila pilipes]
TALAKILRWIAPQFPVAALDLSLVCSCPEKVKKMEEDPLRFHGFCKAGFGASLVDACKEIQKRIPSITFPFVIYQGEDDKLCIPEGAALLYEKAASEDKTIRSLKTSAYLTSFSYLTDLTSSVLSDDFNLGFVTYVAEFASVAVKYSKATQNEGLTFF